MFTGLVKDIGTVLEKKAGSEGAFLKIATRLRSELNMGDSIAVNGACLTAAGFNNDGFQADMMPETLKATNLQYLQPGDRVNLEPALTLQDRLGGHLVGGHVDCIGQVIKIRPESNALDLQVKVPVELMKFIAVKGSIAVDGVSLTVQGVSNDSFTVSLIPHTARSTTLQYLKLNDRVNIEADMLARYVANLWESRTGRGGISAGFLADHGFIP